MSTATWNRELLDASHRLDDALTELDGRTREWAEADRAWRRARAESYARQKGFPGTVPEKEAVVEMETADGRYEAQLAEGLKVSALEAVRSRRTQLSAIQTLVSLSKAEAELARWGPTEGSAA